MKVLGKLTFWKGVLALFCLLGTYSLYVRIFHGLGAATNLNDRSPWGLWIGFDVLCGVGLAAGGFTVCALVYIFNLERFRPLARPAILTAFLGYLLVGTAITLDIGLPWRIWHPLWYWNPHSVMFEVGWCVTLYLTVLALEFSPAVFERLRWTWAVKIMHTVSIPLVIAGVILSTLHQSSLGSFYLIVPGKLHPLWYSPLLPVHFYISAIGIGFGMVIVESSLSARAFGKSLEMDILSVAAKAMVVVLGVYGLLRIWEMNYRHAFTGVDFLGKEGLYFLGEMALLVAVPVGLFSFRRFRQDPIWLFVGALSAVLGFVLNRLNVAITGMEWSTGTHYTPTWMEWSVSLMFAALGFAIFALAVKYLPIFQHGASHAENPAEVAAA